MQESSSSRKHIMRWISTNITKLTVQKKFCGFQNFRKKVFTLEEVDIDRLNLPEES